MDIPQGYKHTELGIIPEDWALQSVGKHCIVKARIGWQGLRSDEYLESGEYGLITSTDIIDGIIIPEALLLFAFANIPIIDVGKS